MFLFKFKQCKNPEKKEVKQTKSSKEDTSFKNNYTSYHIPNTTTRNDNVIDSTKYNDFHKNKYPVCGLQRNSSDVYCYFNSIMQVLFNNDAINQFLDENDFTDEYLNVIKELKNTTLKNSIVNPSKYYNILFKDGSPLNNNKNIIKYDRLTQNDAVESLFCIIDYIQKYYTINVFDVKLDYYDYCEICKNAFKHYTDVLQTYIILHGSTGSVADIISDCSDCTFIQKKDFCGEKDNVLHKIHSKVKIYEANLYINIQIQSANRQVDSIKFNSTLTIGGVNYKLISFIEHTGDNTSGLYGHYVSYINKNDAWYLIDDSNISALSYNAVETILATKNNIIFGQYRKVK